MLVVSSTALAVSTSNIPDCNSKSSFALVLKVILQLAESVSFLGQVDLFKVRGKFALSDAYEDHFLLPKGKILVVTHRRVILMQVSNFMGNIM